MRLIRCTFTPYILASALTVASPTLSANTFQADTPDELVRAMEQANQASGADVIALRPDREYSFVETYIERRALPPVVGELRIKGNGATLSWASKDPAGFLLIEPDGQLTLTDLTIANARDPAVIVKGSLEADDCRFENNKDLDGGAMRISSTGSARLTQCVFTGNVTYVGIGRTGEVGFGIYNAGQLAVEGSTFFRPLGLPPYTFAKSAAGKTCQGCTMGVGKGPGIISALRFPAATILNDGAAHLSNMTLFNRFIQNAGELEIINGTLVNGAFFNNPDASASVANTLIANGGCSAGTISLGHNLTTVEDLCPLNAETDRLISPLDLQLGPFRADSKLPVFIPRADGLLVDAAGDDACPAKDAFARARPRDGNDNGVARCDIGAVEIRGGEYRIDERVTGLWYDPEHNGHYFHIEQPRPGFIVVFWATYDAGGDPMWLYASGPTHNNGAAQLVLYRQTGMRFGEFDRGALKVDEWGTLDLTFLTCRNARAVWNAFDGTGLDGSATLSKLADTEGRECLR